MRTRGLSLLCLAGMLAGCIHTGEGSLDATAAPMRDSGFRVPPLRVGDSFLYDFGFQTQTFTAGGQTRLDVLERTRTLDGHGRSRDAIHVRQASPGGGFGEEYWVDATNLHQFRLQRNLAYAEASHFPPSAASAVPVRHAMYGNGTGTLDRYLEDAVFEDFSFFGAFATGRDLPEAGPFNVTGTLFQRNATTALISGPWPASIGEGASDETWGALKTVEATVEYASGADAETMHWKGAFARTVPLAVDVVRHITARFGKEQQDVTFNVTLRAYKPGTGDELVRVEGTVAEPPRAAERGAWTLAPPEGSAAKLPFAPSEAITALNNDPTASQYFVGHRDAYLRYAHLYEIDTCGVYGATPPPGCHWYTWFGIFGAADDQELWWQAEKYADGTGSGVTLVPPVSREYPFDTLFNAMDGDPPEAPGSTVVVKKSSQDLPPRTAFDTDAYTLSAVLDTWKALATPVNQNLVPNSFALYLQDGSYNYYVARTDWVYATPAPTTALYDRGNLELPRHAIYFDRDGWVSDNTNYDVKVTQT